MKASIGRKVQSEVLSWNGDTDDFRYTYSRDTLPILSTTDNMPVSHSGLMTEKCAHM